MLTAMIFSNLTRVSHELKAEPQLAHTWEANEDSSEWTFHLVKNAKFTNGRPVTAHDVKFSFDRILDPETASRGRKAMGLFIPSFYYQMTPKISLNIRCSISISKNLSINGRTRSSGQLGIWSYNINP